MKHKWITAVLLWLCGGMAVFAVELGTTIGIIGSDPALNEIFGTDADNMALFFAGNAWTGFDISENMGLTITVDHDPVLMTRIIPVLEFSYNLVSLKVGPFMGFQDIRTIDVNPGISMSLDIAAPGIVFGSIRFDTTIGGGNIALRNSAQELWEVKAGFWTSHVIFSLSAHSRSSATQKEAEIYTKMWTRYTLSLDFFQKNVPRTWRFDFGFQQLKWLSQSRPEDGYEYGAFFLGAEFHIKLNYTTEIILGGEISNFLWNFENGVRWELEKKPIFETRFGIVWGIGK
jgi:hypothetical protein